MAGGPLDLWNAWSTQILVLLSLALQIFLLLLAGIRRCGSSFVLKFFLWLAYMLADTTAIYALGHLSLSSVIREHKLVAFWAPFLLLHLGGPDNITAYALQDNQLWLRHLQILVVQVLGAGYVLYKRIIMGGMATVLLLATVLMFVVGLVKYCERTWALKQSDFSSIQSSVKDLPRKQIRWYRGHLQSEDHYNSNDGFLLQRAHSLFHICKRGIVDSVINVDTEIIESESTKKIINNLKRTPKKMWKVMEMELSLMYDILYTKAAVIHTSIGYCIRVFTSVAIAASFLLFHFSGSKDLRNGVDVIVTYVLLGGALVMETTSLLSALGSSWALSFLCGTRWRWLQHVALCGGRWQRFRRVVVNLRWIVTAMTLGLLGRSRNWPNTIGQFNLLYFRAAQVHESNHWLGRIVKMLGGKDWWDSTCYSSRFDIPEMVKDKVVKRLDKDDINTMGLLRHKWDELPLNKDKYPNLKLAKRLKELRAVDFHENVIIWHIATDMILFARESSMSGGDNVENKKKAERVHSIRAISNYLMFLLVTQPDMLPGIPQNWLYQRTCENLDEKCRENRQQLISSGGKVDNLVFRLMKKLLLGDHNSTTTMFVGLKQTNELAKILLKMDVPKEFDPSVPRLGYARGIAEIWLKWNSDEELKDLDPVDMLLRFWLKFLIYAANRCNRECHAKKLSSGGEFTTVVWLMVEHIYQTKEKKPKSET
ncbi:uncharacterized protein LOC127771525 [Oryza glaberrima]|uniref:DUF4220 domain-containing protein n=2 Tax=Oryza glaberrima TaxID=4538 RepID=A0A0U1WYJ6_ORYGL|nr:uncharacterized protein LOC127771525 [Oryza glaberrima]AHW98642.1 hypothetical protein [Oryza glaberrima]